MTYLALFLVVVLVAVLAGAVVALFALLKRLDAANQRLVEQASEMMKMAREQAQQQPYQLERMMDSLADSTARIHATIESTVKAVLVPPPMQVIDGPGVPYAMPTMPVQPTPDQERPWDHTDRFMPNPDTGPKADMGYEYETEPGFDEDNPMGIPGLTAPWASPQTAGV